MGNVLSAPIRERAGSRRDTHEELRKREPLKARLAVQIRPLDHLHQHREELLITAAINRQGIYFDTPRNHYYVGMSLFLAFSYSASTLVRKEYLGEVVRVDRLPNGSHFVAVKFLS
jgi:hypothetical protein